MKSIEEIIKDIEIKIKEHKDIIEEVNYDIKGMRKDAKLETAQKYMILKDKILFHQSSVMVLTDLLKGIKD